MPDILDTLIPNSTGGERIRQARFALGLSRLALAQRLGVTRQSISRWESGVALPLPINGRDLADALGWSNFVAGYMGRP
jgi:transcriptional regulator with XRE-family HTH domain